MFAFDFLEHECDVGDTAIDLAAGRITSEWLDQLRQGSFFRRKDIEHRDQCGRPVIGNQVARKSKVEMTREVSGTDRALLSPLSLDYRVPDSARPSGPPRTPDPLAHAPPAAHPHQSPPPPPGPPSASRAHGNRK